MNLFFMAIGGVALLVLMMLAVVNVGMGLIGKSLHGAYELMGYCGAVAIAFSLGGSQRRKDHILVDVLTRHFPEWVNRLLDVTKYILSMIFFGLVSWKLFQYGMMKIQSGELSSTLKIPFYPFVFCVALGFALLVITLLIDAILACLQPPPGAEEVFDDGELPAADM